MDHPSARRRRLVAVIASLALLIGMLATFQIGQVFRPQAAQASTTVPASDIVMTDGDFGDYTEIASLNPSTGSVSNLTGTDYSDQYAAVTIGGGKIAYQSEGHGGDGSGDGLYIMNGDGSDPTQVTSDTDSECGEPECNYNYPSWNPAGNAIVFENQYESGDDMVYQIDELSTTSADPSDPDITVLATGDDGGIVDTPSWSPSGSKIAYSYCPPGGGGCDIYVMDSNGDDPTEVVGGATNANYYDDPVWSPDGSTLYFDNGSNIYSAPSDSSDDFSPTALTSGSGDQQPTVSADGNVIAYTDNGAVYTMNSDGSDQEQVTSGYTDYNLSYVSPSPPADASMPDWWHDTLCDTYLYSDSYALGASYDGVQACGPGPEQGGTDTPVYFYTHAAQQLEWECVELVMRYMYLVYGIDPYGVNGDDVVSDYSGDVLTKVDNSGTAHVLPIPGDVISEDDGTDGHTAVVTAVNVSSSGDGVVWIMEQNVEGDGDVDGWNTITVSDWLLGSDVTGWLHQ